MTLTTFLLLLWRSVLPDAAAFTDPALTRQVPASAVLSPDALKQKAVIHSSADSYAGGSRAALYRTQTVSSINVQVLRVPAIARHPSIRKSSGTQRHLKSSQSLARARETRWLRLFEIVGRLFTNRPVQYSYR